MSEKTIATKLNFTELIADNYTYLIKRQIKARTSLWTLESRCDTPTEKSQSSSREQLLRSFFVHHPSQDNIQLAILNDSGSYWFVNIYKQGKVWIQEILNSKIEKREYTSREKTLRAFFLTYAPIDSFYIIIPSIKGNTDSKKE